MARSYSIKIHIYTYILIYINTIISNREDSNKELAISKVYCHLHKKKHLPIA